MIDQLIKGALAVAGAVAAYLVADTVTESVTGKHIHEHLAELWSRVVDKIDGWLKSAVGTAHVVLTIAKDDLKVGAKRVMKAIGFIEERPEEPVVITEETLSSEEVESLIKEKQLEGARLADLEDEEMSYYLVC